MPANNSLKSRAPFSIPWLQRFMDPTARVAALRDTIASIVRGEFGDATTRLFDLDARVSASMRTPRTLTDSASHSVNDGTLSTRLGPYRSLKSYALSLCMCINRLQIGWFHVCPSSTLLCVCVCVYVCVYVCVRVRARVCVCVCVCV